MSKGGYGEKMTHGAMNEENNVESNKDGNRGSRSVGEMGKMRSKKRLLSKIL